MLVALVLIEYGLSETLRFCSRWCHWWEYTCAFMMWKWFMNTLSMIWFIFICY